MRVALHGKDPIGGPVREWGGAAARIDPSIESGVQIVWKEMDQGGPGQRGELEDAARTVNY
jgi:hypothetical protein